MAQKRFHRHFETPGLPLYWIIIAYIILGWFFPVIGLLAIICMIGPVVTSIFKGRWWCGHVCPRGNMYDRLLSKYSPHRPIPKFVRTFGFRLFMVFFIFTMFGIQLSFVPWSEGGLPMWAGIGKVFWTIIVMTTIVGVTLSFIYAPRTWCSFCPMGTISNWVAPKKAPLPKAFTNIHVSSACQMKCKQCARVCPMQLTPYDSRGEVIGYLHPDCLKCGKCVLACPTKIVRISLSHEDYDIETLRLWRISKIISNISEATTIQELRLSLLISTPHGAALVRLWLPCLNVWRKNMKAESRF